MINKSKFIFACVCMFLTIIPLSARAEGLINLESLNLQPITEGNFVVIGDSQTSVHKTTLEIGGNKLNIPNERYNPFRFVDGEYTLPECVACGLYGPNFRDRMRMLGIGGATTRDGEEGNYFYKRIELEVAANNKTVFPNFLITSKLHGQMKNVSLSNGKVITGGQYLNGDPAPIIGGVQMVKDYALYAAKRYRGSINPDIVFYNLGANNFISTAVVSLNKLWPDIGVLKKRDIKKLEREIEKTKDQFLKSFENNIREMYITGGVRKMMIMPLPTLYASPVFYKAAQDNPSLANVINNYSKNTNIELAEKIKYFKQTYHELQIIHPPLYEWMEEATVNPEQYGFDSDIRNYLHEKVFVSRYTKKYGFNKKDEALKKFKDHDYSLTPEGLAMHYNYERDHGDPEIEMIAEHVTFVDDLHISQASTKWLGQRMMVYLLQNHYDAFFRNKDLQELAIRTAEESHHNYFAQRRFLLASSQSNSQLDSVVVQASDKKDDKDSNLISFTGQNHTDEGTQFHEGWNLYYSQLGTPDWKSSFSQGDNDLATAHLLGLDYRNNGYVMGFAASGEASDTDELKQSRLSVYGGFVTDNGININANLSTAMGKESEDRQGFDQVITKEDQDTQNLSVNFNMSKNFALSDSLTLKPRIGLHYDHFSQSGYSETYADRTVSFEAQEQTFLYGKIGFNLEYDHDYEWGGLHLTSAINYAHAIKEEQGSMGSTLHNAFGTVEHKAEAQKQGNVLNLGFHAETTLISVPSLSLSFDYEANILGDKEASHEVMGQLKLHF